MHGNLSGEGIIESMSDSILSVPVQLKRRRTRKKKSIPVFTQSSPVTSNNNNIIVNITPPAAATITIINNHSSSNNNNSNNLSDNNTLYVDDVAPSVNLIKEISNNLFLKTKSTDNNKNNNINNNNNYNNLSRNQAVSKLLNFLIDRKQFSLLHIKRSMDTFLLERNGPDVSVLGARIKPSGLHIKEMWDPWLCTPGETVLPPNSHKLNISAMDKYHVESCPNCSPFNVVQANCYFSQLRLCIVNGWSPPMEQSSIQEKYRTDRNYPACASFPITFQKEVDSLTTSGVLRTVPQEELDRCGQGIISPLGMKIKGSDIARGLVQTGILVTDESKMIEVNNLLLQMGSAKIKARITTDVTASGINEAAYSPPFIYASHRDAIHLMEEGDFLCKGDVSRYFLNFPLAEACRWMFRIRIAMIILEYLMVFFGLTSSPFYASTWSAEFCSWAKHKGIPCIVMMDDWLTKGKTESLANIRMDSIEEFMITSGFEMDSSKRFCFQTLVYLGIEFNTIKMTMKMDRIQCRNIQIELSFYLTKIINKQFISSTQICHIAGVLQWYSEVIQSGRIRIRYWWKYMRKGNHLNNYDRKQLIADTTWWIDLLNIWADDNYSGNEYKIFSATEIQKPNQIFVLQSDSSGTDGFGYHGGILGNNDQQYTSCRWQPAMFEISNQVSAEYNSAASLLAEEIHYPKSISENSRISNPSCVVPPSEILKIPILVPQISAKPAIFRNSISFRDKISTSLELSAGAPIFIPGSENTSFLSDHLEKLSENLQWIPHQLPQSSIWGEIYALKHFLENNSTVKDKLFIWVSDSLNAVYDINKGRCGSEEDAELLRAIFYLCDKNRLQLIAVWVPRELNEMADYLSHLSFICNRDSTSGNVADLEGANPSR
jgi:hypothetical protein